MIPLATTTITVTRIEAGANVDPYDPDPPAPTTVATDIRAVISPPTASVGLSGGNRVEYGAALRCDPVSLLAGDTVTDSTGTAWMVLWAREVNALGLSFMESKLRLIEGAT